MRRLPNRGAAGTVAGFLARAGWFVARAGAEPHAVLASAPPDTVVAELVANLARRCAARAAVLVTPDGVVGWPPGELTAGLLAPATGATELAAALGPGTLVAAILDGRRERGVLAVASAGGPNGVHRAEHHRVLCATATCLAIALRGQRLRVELHAAGDRAAVLAARHREVGERLAAVRDLERRRLVTAIVADTTRQLDDVRDAVRSLSDAYLHEPDQAPAALRTVAGRLDDLIGHFRAVVRGVHPSVLRERGPLAALEELAADLPRRVRIEGDLGRRAGWEVESGFYHGVAAVLQLLTAAQRPHPLVVQMAQDGDRLTAAVTDHPAPGVSATRLDGSLADDADRVTALGGTFGYSVAGDTVTVRVSFPRRIELPDHADADHADVGWADADAGRAGAGLVGDGPEPRSAPRLLDQLRALAITAATDDPLSAAAWRSVAARLGEPPRVAVAGSPDSARAALVDALLGHVIATTATTTAAVSYVDGPGRHVLAQPRTGRPQRVPLAVADLARLSADAEHLVVECPSPLLTALTLVDLPEATGQALADVEALVLVLPGRSADAAVRQARAAGVRRVVGVVLMAPAPEAVGAPGAPEAQGTSGLPGAIAAPVAPGAEPRCDAVVAVDVGMAFAAATLGDSEYRALQRLAGTVVAADAGQHPEPLPRLGAAGTRVAVEAIRGGAAAGTAQLAVHLQRVSGLDGLRAAIAEHITRHADVLLARWGLRTITGLFGARPPDALARELERVTLAAHELVELDLLDAIRSGALTLPDADAVAATRLLGAAGRSARERLGLTAAPEVPNAGAAEALVADTVVADTEVADTEVADTEVAAAAAAALDHWRRRADHPAAARAVRDACAVLARTCETILATA